MMRTIAVAAAAILLSHLAHAQVQLPSHQADVLRPYWGAYKECALARVTALAALNPTLTFEQQEVQIKPACGHLVRTFAAQFVNVTGNPDHATFVRQLYDFLQPKLRESYYAAALGEAQRQNAVAQQAKQDAQTKQVEAERTKIFKELHAEHQRCVMNAMTELVPYSNEAADPLSTVVMTKCSDFERRKASLATAVYAVPRSEADKLVAETSAELRRWVMAKIVTVRAAAVKEGTLASDQPKAFQPGVVPAGKAF